MSLIPFGTTDEGIQRRHWEQPPVKLSWVNTFQVDWILENRTLTWILPTGEYEKEGHLFVSLGDEKRRATAQK
jgi:hypothetical protein